MDVGAEAGGDEAELVRYALECRATFSLFQLAELSGNNMYPLILTELATIPTAARPNVRKM
jgi:hypothetical protein